MDTTMLTFALDFTDPCWGGEGGVRMSQNTKATTKSGIKEPTTILAMLTLFAVAAGPGAAIDIQDRVERASGKRPSDGAFFAALKGLCTGGLATKSEAKRPVYRITADGGDVAKRLYRQVDDGAPPLWGVARA